MAKKKEGRQKDLPTDMPSEEQRMMIRDFHDFRITGFNPHDDESYECTKFHQFRDEYKQHPYAVFLVNVQHAARIVQSHMTSKETKAAKNLASEMQETWKANGQKKDKTKDKTVTFNEADNDLSDMMQGLKFQRKLNLTDPIVKAYPCDNKLLFLIELLGDVGDAENSNAFQFGS